MRFTRLLTINIYIEMKKISIYGAGQIGLAMMSNIMLNKTDGHAEVVMYSPHNHKRIEGAYMDLCDACALSGFKSGWIFKPTNDTSEIAESDIVFLCAGDSPTPEEYAACWKKGIDDRMLQAQKNISILKAFCADVKKYAPNALVFIVSNPVDMMSEMARLELPEHQVYGMGCYLDTARFKREFFEALSNDGQKCLYDDIYQAWILGHHCGTMFLHKESFYFRDKEEYSPEHLAKLVDTALARTRNRGLEITEVNRAATTKKLNNGAYYAPSLMVVKVITTIVNDKWMQLPLNRPIIAQDGVPSMVGYQAQLLCSISQGGVEPCCLKMRGEDAENLIASVETYEQTKKNFFSAYEVK